MASLRGTRRTYPPGRAWTTLSVLLLLASAGYLDSWAQAQTTAAACETTRTIATPIRIENSTGVGILRDEANCTNRGSLKAEWAGAAVTIGDPIAIASGTFLSVTGDDALAEVQGGSQTRLFEVSPGGSLTLTQLKLSGGAAAGNGGAIYSDAANLTLDNCTFDGNIATDGDGGAVWADQGFVTIAGGEFSGNTAGRYGGAVLATGASLVVKEGARFEGNDATVGGALYCSGLAGTGLPTRGSGASCSIRDAEFVSNNAVGTQNDVGSYAELDGGGAAAFLHGNVTVARSVFSGNYALLSGGGLFGGNATDIRVDGCTFENNTSGRYGGAIAAASMTLGGGTRLTDNTASSNGGAVFGWDAGGTITFSDVVCEKNTATRNGGCFYAVGTGTATNGTVMHDNKAENGGCIYAFDGSDVSVDGGDFMCQCTERGGFIFVGDGTRVKITGGLFANNLAIRRAGVMYCNGYGESSISIEGGTFRDNRALEVGGAIVAWGVETVVKVTGGLFSNNSAKFYGGFIFVEEEASLTCEGAIITNNYAGDQGGGIYAREATWVNSSCNLIASESPQGAAIYLTNVMSATFENHTVADNLASGGSVVFVAASNVVARDVTFASGVGLQEDSSNRAIQLDGTSTLNAEKCTFNGWLGDAVIYHINSATSSLVLDSCDFRESSATMAVISSNSDAEIRNAVVSSFTFENAVTGTLNSSLTLVDQALDCSDSNACGAGECVDSTLGVMCECLESGECLNDGGELSLYIADYPADVTYFSDPVTYKLEVSSAVTGTTYAIWDLDFEADDLALEVVPSSGVLPPGGTVTVSVTGTSTEDDVGGDLVSNFTVTSVGSTKADATLAVTSTFYLCRAYEYALPRDDKDEDPFSCERCATIEGEEGVDCDSPGATLASLPIREGFWRASRESPVVHACLHSDACVGATEVSSSDDYCDDGYKGPYCAVCTDGYGRGVSNSCHFCEDTKARLLIALAALFCLVVVLFLLLAVVFLIGGLDAIAIVRQTVTRKNPFGSNASAGGIPVPGLSLQGRKVPQLGPGNYSADTVAPAYDSAPKLKRGGEGTTSHDRMAQSRYSESSEVESTYDWRRYADAGVGACVAQSDAARRYDTWDGGVSAPHPAGSSAVADAHVGGAQVFRGGAVEADGGAKPKCCGLGDKVKRLMSRLPLNKLKILVVVWQILAVFSSITGVGFPASYATFLSWISVVNLDLGNIFSASCVLPSVNFYVSLLVTTVGPLALAGVLVLTYHMAKHRSGIGRAGVIARRAAWSRHVAAGLLLTFLVFTSASTAVFKTLDCDKDVVKGESYLRADYSLSCETDLHMFFQVYAVLMILVYPVGIPFLYATILWKNRELLNPSISHTEPDGASGALARGDLGSGDDKPAAVLCITSKKQAKTRLSSEELQELEEKVEARRENPELVPSMFLWKDFGPDLYYYEVVECGRRILLTGVLIFISPSSATQAAMACIFAFGSLLGFELMRPHLDPADSWLYRLGCVIIFLSNFLALLIKVDAGESGNREVFGALMVAVNVLLVLAVLLTSWFATQQSVDDERDGENSFTMAKTMLTAEQYAADSARLTRSGRPPPRRSSASSGARPGLQPSDRGVVWRGPEKTLRRQVSGATARSDEALPTLARYDTTSSPLAGVWNQNSEDGSGWH